MAEDTITVRAEVQLLPTAKGGRATPVRGSYRPNHNFFGPENREMAVGFIELPDGRDWQPGESLELPITFLRWPRLDAHIHVGCEWAIQEGPKMVGTGRVLQVLSDSA